MKKQNEGTKGFTDLLRMQITHRNMSYSYIYVIYISGDLCIVCIMFSLCVCLQVMVCTVTELLSHCANSLA